MTNFKQLTFLVSMTIFLCGCDVSRRDNQSELINSLKNSPDKHQRIKSALQLQQFIDSQTIEAFYERIENDSSSEVQVVCIRGLKKALGKSLREINEKRDVIAGQKIDQAYEVHRARLRPFLKKSYVFKGKYPSEVKAKMVRFFMTSDKNEDFILLQTMLRDLCDMPFEERKTLEKRRPYQGNSLLSSLIATMGRSRGRNFVTPEKLHYSTNIEDKFIPLLENDLKKAKGDYKLSLLIILGEMSTHTKFDLKEKKRVKFFALTQKQLQEIDDLLVTTESRSLKRNGLTILNGYGHQFSDEAKNIIKDFQVRAKSGIKS